MSKRSYTVMIMPGSRAKLWRWKLRRGFAWAFMLVAGAGLISALALPIVTWNSLSKSSELETLRAENSGLKDAATEIATLREQLAEFESKATKFALMAGVENLPSAQGVGGLRNDDASAYAGELGNLNERSGVLLQSFDMLEKVYQDQSLLLASTPSIAPVDGMVSYGFGWRRDPFTGNRAFHKGLDIVAQRGTAIMAPADGVVTKAARFGGYGKVVYLSHGNGLTTRYAHLDGFEVKAGQEVKRGDVLGYLGNTGRSLGAHLHYEVLVNNTKVNPVQYILDDNAAF